MRSNTQRSYSPHLPITLTARTSWNEPRNTHSQGRRAEAPQTMLESHCSENRAGKGSLSKGPSHLSPFTELRKSLRDQNTNVFKESHFVVFSTRWGAHRTLCPLWTNSCPFKACTGAGENNVLQGPAGVAFESFGLRSSDPMRGKGGGW